MVTVKLWEILALVVILAAVFRAVRVWLVIAAVLLGLYLASTSGGKATRHTIDQITNPSTASTTHR